MTAPTCAISLQTIDSLRLLRQWHSHFRGLSTGFESIASQITRQGLQFSEHNGSSVSVHPRVVWYGSWLANRCDSDCLSVSHEGMSLQVR